MNAFTLQRPATASSVISNPMLDRDIAADTRAPLITTLSSSMIGPPQPCLTANQDVMLDDAVAFNQGILRNL